MAIEVSWPDDVEKFPQTSAVGPNGRTMTRTALVTGTGDHLVALFATGIPRYGDEFGNSGMFCQTVKAIRIGGWDRNGDNSSGCCRVTCEYSTVPINWQYAATGPESNYTEIDYTRRSLQVMWGWNPGGPFDGVPTSGPINNGEGASKEVAGFSLKIHAYTLQPQNIDLARMLLIGANGSRNSNAMVLPPLKRPNRLLMNPPTLSFGVGQLRYMGPESTNWILSATGTNYIYEVVHLLEAAPDWLTQWTKTNQDGVPISSNAAQIYGLADLGGLW